MCGRHKHGGYCCSQQPWQHAYCFVVNKGLPPWHNTVTAPDGVSGHQVQLGPARNLAPSQHAAIPGTGQGQRGLRGSRQLRRAPAEEGLNAPEGRAESGTCVRGQQRVNEVMLLLVQAAYVSGNTINSLVRANTNSRQEKGGAGAGAGAGAEAGIRVLQPVSAGRCGTHI